VVNFKAAGACLAHVKWTADGADPATGTGETFATKWDSVGVKTVQAVCAGSSSSSSSTPKTIQVTVVEIASVIVDGSDPEDSGPIDVALGLSVNLRAKRNPVPPNGPFPADSPSWQQDGPNPFAFGQLLPTKGPTTNFAPSELGTWTITATCCDSSVSITVNCVPGCDFVEDVTPDGCFSRMGTNSGPNAADVPIDIVGPKGSSGEVVTLTVSLKATGDAAKVNWTGATQDATDPLKATVPIDESLMKIVKVKYNGEDCREVHVWPVSAHVEIKTSGTLSPNNKAPGLTSGGEWPPQFGGGTQLGPENSWDNPQILPMNVSGRAEASATISPAGVGDIIDDGMLFFRRIRTSIWWLNGGHYVGLTWEARP